VRAGPGCAARVLAPALHCAACTAGRGWISSWAAAAAVPAKKDAAAADAGGRAGHVPYGGLTLHRLRLGLPMPNRRCAWGWRRDEVRRPRTAPGRADAPDAPPSAPRPGSCEPGPAAALDTAAGAYSAGAATLAAEPEPAVECADQSDDPRPGPDGPLAGPVGPLPAESPGPDGLPGVPGETVCCSWRTPATERGTGTLESAGPSDKAPAAVALFAG
jgi:hypothetical protein